MIKYKKYILNKMKITLTLLISSLFLLKCDNPMAQTTYTADPAPMVYKDKLYVYTGHDADGATYFEMPD